MTQQHSLISLVFVIALGGCSSVADQVKSIDATVDCCSSYREMAFQPLSSSKRLEFSVSNGSRPFTFQSTKSYFAAFSLPGVGGKQIELRSKVLGFSNVTRDTFCPSVVFLDDAHTPIEWFDVTNEWSPAGWTKSGYFSGKVTAPARARYMVVYTTKAKNGATVAMSTPRNKLPYVMPDRGSIVTSLPCAPTGDLSAEILESAGNAS